MTAQAQVGEVTKTAAYRLVVFNRPGTAVLLEGHAGGYKLPLIYVPRFTRCAEEVTSFLRDRWGISSVLLFSTPLYRNADPVYFAAIEAQVRTCSPPHGMDWFPIHHAMSQLLKDKDQNVLENVYLKAMNSSVSDDSEPFSRLGWLSNLQDWVRTVISPLGMELKDFRQLNGSETFSLIRFDTTQRPVWFKAVGDPNLHEYGITKGLADHYPTHLPRIIATRPEWHGWLMAEVEGTRLDNTVELNQWQMAVSTFASLQIDLVGKTDWLLGIGCKDRRILQILNEIDPFLELMIEVMLRQPKTPPGILTRDELLELGKKLKDACYCLQELGIPDSLIHGDFNLGNTYVNSNECVFMDWAEGQVGPPFITFEHLLAVLNRARPEFSEWETPLRAAYAQPWKKVISPGQISEALLLTPLLAVLSYALGGSGWRDATLIREPHLAKHMRSLVRRMHREVVKQERARALSARGISCTKS